MKIKTEASGWPVECNCDQTETCSHRRDFLRDFEPKEGVKLNEENMERNEGLRFISKILLNSFWCYLGMRENLPKTRYVNNYPDVVKYFTSNFSRVFDATLVEEDLMLLQYQMIDDAADIPRKSNAVLAAFTTAHARSILYQHISKVKNPQNVLYCDTDSIMYIDEQVSGLDAHRDIPIGSYLGDMPDELPKTVTVDNFFLAGQTFTVSMDAIMKQLLSTMFLKSKISLLTEQWRKRSISKRSKNWFFRRCTSCAPHLAQCVVALKLIKFKHSFAKK